MTPDTTRPVPSAPARRPAASGERRIPGPSRTRTSNGTTPEHGIRRRTARPPIPALRSNDPALLATALRTAQDNLVALQKLAEQTAQLHRQFLEGQDRTQQTFQTLLEQQQRLSWPRSAAARPAPAPSVATASVATSLRRPAGDVRPASRPPRPSSAARPIGRARHAPRAALRPAAAAGASRRSCSTVVAEKTGYPAEMLELGHAARRRPRHRLDQARRDPLGPPGTAPRRCPSSSPSTSASLRTLGEIVEFLGRPARAAATPPRRRPPRTRRPLARRSQEALLAIVAEKTGLSRRDARAGHAARRRPGHRLDQARRDPLGAPGTAPRRARHQARAPRHPPDASGRSSSSSRARPSGSAVEARAPVHPRRPSPIGRDRGQLEPLRSASAARS